MSDNYTSETPFDTETLSERKYRYAYYKRRYETENGKVFCVSLFFIVFFLYYCYNQFIKWIS